MLLEATAMTLIYVDNVAVWEVCNILYICFCNFAETETQKLS